MALPDHVLIQIEVRGRKVGNQTFDARELPRERISHGPIEHLRRISAGIDSLGLQRLDERQRPVIGGQHDQRIGQAHCSVDLLEELSQYQVETKAGRELTVIAPNRDGDSADSIGPGRDVSLAWDPIHTFVVQRQEPTDHE
jgi:hypothetical protein